MLLLLLLTYLPIDKRYLHVFFYVILCCMNFVNEKQTNINPCYYYGIFIYKHFFFLFYRGDRENQFHEYTLTIYNITFEDETDIEIIAKSSASEKTKTIKPHVTGPPVGQFAFIPNEIPRIIPWRDEQYKDKLNIYSYGTYKDESYRVVCTVRHRADIEQPLKVFIHNIPCSVDNCLSNFIDRGCPSSSSTTSMMTTATRLNKFQTQFVSTESKIIDNPLTAHQYICCYEQNGLTTLAKSVTALARKRKLLKLIENETKFKSMKDYVVFTSDIALSIEKIRSSTCLNEK